MRLILDNNAIKFEPEFNDYIDILVNVYEVMIKAVSFVPRVETKLYSKWVSNEGILIARVCVIPCTGGRLRADRALCFTDQES